MSTPNHVEKLRVAYKKWHDTRGQSVADWVALMADDVQVRSVADGAPGMEFSAPRSGKAAMQGYFSALHADWEMLSYSADEFVTEGDTVVVFGRCAFKNRNTGKVADTPFVARWKFRNGLVADFYELYDTAKAFAAATPDAK